MNNVDFTEILGWDKEKRELITEADKFVYEKSRQTYKDHDGDIFLINRFWEFISSHDCSNINTVFLVNRITSIIEGSIAILQTTNTEINISVKVEDIKKLIFLSFVWKLVKLSLIFKLDQGLVYGLSEAELKVITDHMSKRKINFETGIGGANKSISLADYLASRFISKDVAVDYSPFIHSEFVDKSVINFMTHVIKTLLYENYTFEFSDIIGLYKSKYNQSDGLFSRLIITVYMKYVS